MSTPFVSVIVPVYNDSKRLQNCLRALEDQTYSKSCYEVIVVDNNSSEDIASIVGDFQKSQYLFETISGSYAARNKGIAHARGEVFAFTDSDCLPQAHWLQEGVAALEDNAAALAGGQVTFTFSSRRGAAELYDSVTNMQIKENIETRKISKTANLFAYKYVFDKVGFFPAHLVSGGDVMWTQRATDASFKLVYAAKAEVFHPARTLWPLMKKQYRVGGGQFDILRAKGQTIPTIAKDALKALLKPPSIKTTQAFSDRKGLSNENNNLLSIWFVRWMCKASMGMGRLNRLAKEASPLKR